MGIASLVLSRRETTAKDGMNSQCLKIIRGYNASRGPFSVVTDVETYGRQTVDPGLVVVS